MYFKIVTAELLTALIIHEAIPPKREQLGRRNRRRPGCCHPSPSPVPDPGVQEQVLADHKGPIPISAASKGP